CDGAVRAVPVPNAVVEPQDRPRQQPGVTIRDRSLLHRPGQERGPGELQVTRTLAYGLPGALFARALAVTGEQSLFGNQNPVALDLVLGQVKAVVDDRSQRLYVYGMLDRELVEADAETLDCLVHDLEQAVLL